LFESIGLCEDVNKAVRKRGTVKKFTVEKKRPQMDKISDSGLE
jgi:hypothetical protein